MTAFQIANVFQAAIVLLSFLILTKLYSVFRLDSFRQQMFELRDQVFDYAADGNMSFQDPAYLLIREQMNTMIRYGHQLTFYRLVMSRLVPKIARAPQRDLWGPEWIKALDSVESPEIREQLLKFHERERIIQMRRVLGSSLVLSAVVLLAGLAYLVKHGLSPLTQFESAAKNRFMRGPMDFRYIEEDASMCAVH